MYIHLTLCQIISSNNENVEKEEMGNHLSYRKIKSENIKDILEDYENALKNDEHKDFFNKRLLPKLSNSNIYNKNDNENINKIFELKLPFIRSVRNHQTKELGD